MPLQDDGIQEDSVPITRAPQVMDGTQRLRSDGADIIWDVQRQVYVETTERTGVYKTVDKRAASPPYMQVTIEDVLVRCGEMAKFHAIIEGNPQPTIAWFKGIFLLTDSERIYQFNEGTSYSLVLYNTKPEDGGVYTCIAKNTEGEVLCKAELVVQEDKKSQEAKKQSTRRKLHAFYEVKQEIGRGSFGFVKKVVHKDNRVSCAAKFIPLRSKTRDQTYQERDVLATLSHDRITQLLDQFETRKTLILVLELCSNEELLDRLFRKNVVTETEVKQYIKQLLEGIGYLHHNQVLHLDIKPPNILMVYDDRDDIKICDFGFAQKINPAEPQYSKYGSPEFVSPEILSQSPVSMASDIWPVGVISYLSLTCKSPFAGENDRTTLLNIQKGTISWDIPDFVHLSEEAKDFIQKILQKSPGARPSATECLSHRWLVHNPPLEESHFIDTKQLKFFISRSKWQRSLMSYKSVLVMRPIPEILEKTHKNTSLGISRHLVEESSSSSTSGSSSDNEIAVSPGRKHLGPTPELHFPVLEESSDSEYPLTTKVKHTEAMLSPVKPTRHKQISVKRELGDHPLQEREELMPLEAGAAEGFDMASSQDKAYLLLPEDGKMEKVGDEVGRSPGCVPRHSVIKSTFYSQLPEGLPKGPSSPGKDHRKHLEKAKRTYRKAGYSKSALSGLREPLLEQFEFGEEGGGISGDEETEKFREGGARPLTKSASFDTAQKSPRVTFQVSSRSRSLDDYRMRATSFAEEQYIEEEESESIPPRSPDQVAHQYHASEAGSTASSEKSFTKGGATEMGKEEQQAGKEGLVQKLQVKKIPVLPGAEGMAEYKGGLLQQPPKAPLHKDAVPGFPKEESATLTISQLETIPLVSHDGERGESLFDEAKLTSSQSKRPGVFQGESPVLLKPAPVQGTFKSGDQLPQMPSVQSGVQQAVKADGKSPQAQAVPVGAGHLPVHQKPSVSTEVIAAVPHGRSSSIPTSQAVASAVSVSGKKDQKIQKPSAPSLAKSAVSVGKGPESSQAKTASVSISEDGSQKPLYQTPTMHSGVKPVTEGRGPVCLEAVPVPKGESQHILQKKPSAYNEVVSGVLRSTSSVIQAASQVETAPISISHEESQKRLFPKSSFYSEAVPVLSETRSHPQQTETVQKLIHEGEDLKHLHQRSSVPTEQKTDAFEGERQPSLTTSQAGPVIVSASKSQECGPEKPSVHSEITSDVLKGKRPHMSMASQAKTVPTSVFRAENDELLHHMPSAPREPKSTMRRDQGTSVPVMSPYSVSGGESPITRRKTPAFICEGRIMEDIYQKSSVYSDTEAEALENLVDEMVCLSEEMNILAESVSEQEGSRRHMSPPRELFYQGPPGQAMRPATRYLVRRGKREGGIGLADPSEVDVIYPGEEDYFGVPPFMSKKPRMDYAGTEMSWPSQFASSDFGDRFGYDYGSQGSGRMYEIALVQIQDLYGDFPRPDSKTAKYDISEVEPAFLNLHELYDIVYYPFEFLSFRKAPEKLPSKRRLPLGEKAKLPLESKAHSHQEKKMCIRKDSLQSGAVREAPRDEDEPTLMQESKQAKAPRMGKRSDSEGDIPVGSQQMYGLPEDPTGKRRGSLQSRLGLLKPFVRSQSMEFVEQSLKKKMKASVSHLSRMLTRKSSSDGESREDSEERRGDLQERTSLTEASGHMKKKMGFPSFTLPSLKTKEKAPSFVEELSDQTIALGQSVTLSCRTSAHSSPHIEWFKDGAAIRSTDRILISSTLRHFQLLTILAATADDFGMYTCVATNSQGTVSTSCIIRKAEAPSNPPSPDIVEILEDGVRLAWKPVELNTLVTYSVLCKKEDGEWKTVASDIADCCYTVEHLPRGLVCSFRIACVSKAGVGPYSNPSAKVKIGEKDPAAFESPDLDDGSMTAPAQATQHQTYAFQTEIKRGRFSIIKQCREKLSGNALAAKIIPYRPEDKEAVLQEYHVLRKLQHTNIGQLQGAYVSPRHLVLIVELCVGPELLHALARRSSYSEVEVRDYLWQILSAVEYLHAQNVLHLDLRSENMVITEPNLLKLLDFGNAQFYTPDRVITLDGCTDYVETMASELLSDKGAVPQTDIWAIGVTAFIMLSAEYPISPEAACDFGRFVKRDKIKLNKCYAGLSGGAVSFLQSTLSSNPWRRPSAAECLQSPWLQETGLDERQQATVTFSPTKLRNFLAERERKRALLCSKYGLMTV